MNTLWTMLTLFCLQVLGASPDTVVQDPVLTISGHYRCTDGRVKEHKFPVQMRLTADGNFTGTIPSWIEATLTDGRSLLDYNNDTFTGKWTIKNNAIHLTVEGGTILPQIAFEKMNGLTITIEKRSPNNRLSQ